LTSFSYAVPTEWARRAIRLSESHRGYKPASSQKEWGYFLTQAKVNGGDEGNRTPDLSVANKYFCCDFSKLNKQK